MRRLPKSDRVRLHMRRAVGPFRKMLSALFVTVPARVGQNRHVRQVVRPFRVVCAALFVTVPAWLGRNRYVRAAFRVVRVLFVILLVGFPLVLLLEAIWGISISPYVSFDNLLLAFIITGAVAVLSWSPGEEGRGVPARRDVILAFCSGAAGAAILWHATRGAGWYSYLVTVAGGALVAVAVLLILAEGWTGTRSGEEDGGVH